MDASFRKSKGNIVNIYLLNHAVEKELNREKSKLYAFFTRLALKLWDAIRKALVSSSVIESTKEAINRLKVGNKVKDVFWTKEAV